MGENDTPKKKGLFENEKVIAQAEAIKKKYGANRSTAVPSKFNFEKEYKMLQEAKYQEEKIKYDNNKYLKKLSEDVDTIKADIKIIVDNMTMVNKQLQFLNSALNKSNLKLTDIKDEIDTENRLLADTYETLASLKINDETNRVKSSGELLSSFVDATTLVTNIATIVGIVSGFN